MTHSTTYPPITLRRPSTTTGAATKPYHHPLSATTITATAVPSSSSSPSFSSSVNLELISIKPFSYTSLRDLLPSPETVVNSPRTPHAAAPNSKHEILIRDPLVKQAAWAYLRPMSTSNEFDGTTVFRRMWTRFSGTLLRLVATAFDCILPPVNTRR